MGRWGEGVRSRCRICRSRLGSRCRSRGFGLGAVGGGRGLVSGCRGIGARGEWWGSVVVGVCRDGMEMASVESWAEASTRSQG